MYGCLRKTGASKSFEKSCSFIISPVSHALRWSWTSFFCEYFLFLAKSSYTDCVEKPTGGLNNNRFLPLISLIRAEFAGRMSSPLPVATHKPESKKLGQSEPI